MYFSIREHPLIREFPLPAQPVVTVENYVKWYQIQVLHPNGEVEEVDYPDLGYGTPYVDHTPNPVHVAKWAADHGYAVDSVSFQLMIGRWVYEVGEPFEEKDLPDFDLM